MLDVREILNKICLTNSCLSEELLPTREANTSLSKKVDAIATWLFNHESEAVHLSYSSVFRWNTSIC